MKRFLLSLFLFFIFQKTSFAQYWQQRTDYVIDVTLNDREKTLDGFEKLTYTNNSPDTLTYIWFHLWPNAYKNDQTAYSNQALENGSTDFYFSTKEQRGYINRLDFKIDGVSAKMEDHPQHIDIVKLILPKPLPPSKQITITTPFHVKLPVTFSRSGYNKGMFQVTQWYPKPAVYDSKGWHPMPYLNQGEFYSEFGDLDVRINLPKDYIVAATGDLQSTEEKEWLKNRTANTSTPTSKSKALADTAKAEFKTLNYKQQNVHDFAWFASKNFIVNFDTCQVSGNKIIDVFSFYLPENKKEWSNSVQYAKDAIRTRSQWIGPYPYNVVSVVQGTLEFAGGMEYPTITVISPIENAALLDEVIAHEISHNWFYGILASNERIYPWLDEGLNTFYDYRYQQLKYGSTGSVRLGKGNLNTQDLLGVLLQTHTRQKTDQPINTLSEEFSTTNYTLVAYHKTAMWLKKLEEELGVENFDKAMQSYYLQWKFKHPNPEDFKRSLEQATARNLDEHFALLNTKGPIDTNAQKGLQIISPLKPSSIANYIKSPAKNVLLLSPATGYNRYDKAMIGAIISNYKLPPSKLQFFAVPLYAIGSKKFNGLGKINLGLFSNSFIQKADVFVNASTFSMNDFIDTASNTITAQFQKLVPGVKLRFRENNPRSTVQKYIQWKTYMINEDAFRFSIDTFTNGLDTSILQSVTTEKEGRVLNQLQFVYENFRVLYPHDFTLQVEQSKQFIRPTFTANYFFNYAKGGGLHVRFFAGKFIYLKDKPISDQFSTDRYHLNMTGANGYEDYTYSDYFFGRNEFEGFASQQIMIRDGGFKIRTDLLAEKVGRSDGWLMAVNFNTSFPKKLNPFSVLPIKIPLHIFADVGTYAAAWEKDAEVDRFLFNAGFHIPLLNETINLYFPVIYSSQYTEYVKSVIPKNRLFKTMSFSINLNNKSVKKINRELQF